MIKHLYVIGNGFDVFTGLKTRYVDFKQWLEHSYPFVYENMQDAYEMDGEWWCDFETQLGKLDVPKYVKKFMPPDKPFEEILEENKERRAYEEKYHLPPSSYYESRCAERLQGLLDILQYCFEKWVSSAQASITDAKYTRIEKEDSFFINFNYTDVLEMVYGIPESRVLHIHGRASKHEHLVFGHGSYPSGRIISSIDEQRTCDELNKYQKIPFIYICKYDWLPDLLKDVEFVHVYGFSFSSVDMGYIEWIWQKTPKDSKWEVSWYSDEDDRRINGLVFEHWDLKERLTRMQLVAVEEREMFRE